MITYKVKVYDNGNQYWHLEGTDLYHREGAPAVVHTDGHKAWYQHGALHNESGAAVVHDDGRKEWWLNDHKFMGPKSYRAELENRRRTEARLKREKEQDALTFAMMHPPVFMNLDKWRIQPKCEFLPLLLRWDDIRDQANAFWAGWNYGEPTHKVEVTMATLESLLGHKVKIVKEK